MRDIIGVILALLAGLAFNAGIVIQKIAINKVNGGDRLMRRLLKNRLWLGGFFLQFIFGSPLYAISVGLIGPALVPLLMSLGLICLVWGAARYCGEKLTRGNILGIVILCLGVSALGFSRLFIDVGAQDHFELEFMLRSGLYCAVFTALFLILIKLKSTGIKKTAGWNMALAAASAQNIGNLALGVVTYSLAKFGGGEFNLKLIILFFIVLVLVIAGNFAGITTAQYALKRGDALFVVPLQHIAGHFLPISVFFLVYRPYMPSSKSLILLAIGLVCLVTAIMFLSTKLDFKIKSSRV